MSMPPFREGYGASGVLLHVTSLPSTYGIGDVGPAAVAWVDRVHPALAMAPLQDVLNLGKEARMNQPGSARGNWHWRVTDEMLSRAALESLRDLTRASARTEPAMAAAS
jgi:4-alpha-glucanotransferase